LIYAAEGKETLSMIGHCGSEEPIVKPVRNGPVIFLSVAMYYIGAGKQLNNRKR